MTDFDDSGRPDAGSDPITGPIWRDEAYEPGAPTPIDTSFITSLLFRNLFPFICAYALFSFGYNRRATQRSGFWPRGPHRERRSRWHKRRAAAAKIPIGNK